MWENVFNYIWLQWYKLHILQEAINNLKTYHLWKCKVDHLFKSYIMYCVSSFWKMCELNSILLTKSSKTFNVFPCQCLGTEVSIFLPSSPFFSFSYLNAFRYKVPTCNFPFLFYTTFFIHFPLCISFCPTATINFSYTCFNEVGCLYVSSQPILAFI